MLQLRHPNAGRRWRSSFCSFLLIIYERGEILKIKKEVKITRNCIVAEEGEDIEVPLPIGTACLNPTKRQILLVTGKEFGNPRSLTVTQQGRKVMIYFQRKLYEGVTQLLGGQRSLKAHITPRKNTPHIFIVEPCE